MNQNFQLPPKSYVFGILFSARMGDPDAMRQTQMLYDTYGRDRINQYVDWREESPKREELISYGEKAGGCPRAIRILSAPIVQN
jgi:hypothetical protein